MLDHQLQNLLRETANRLEPETIAAPDLAERVRALHKQARRRRHSAWGLIAALVVASVVGWQSGWLQPGGGPAQFRNNSPLAKHSLPAAELTANRMSRLQAELAAIESQLRITAQTENILRRDRELKTARREAAQDDALEDVRMRLDIVAYQMLQRADELRIAMLPTEEASAAYRHVIELFPHTRSAAVAQSRLAETQN